MRCLLQVTKQSSRQLGRRYPSPALYQLLGLGWRGFRGVMPLYTARWWTGMGVASWWRVGGACRVTPVTRRVSHTFTWRLTCHWLVGPAPLTLVVGGVDTGNGSLRPSAARALIGWPKSETGDVDDLIGWRCEGGVALSDSWSWELSGRLAVEVLARWRQDDGLGCVTCVTLNRTAKVNKVFVDKHGAFLVAGQIVPVCV